MGKQSATTAKETAKPKSGTAKAPKAPRPKRHPSESRTRDTAKGDGKGMSEGSPTLIAKRRELIASARLRGATYSELEVILKESGLKNPSRNKTWSRGTIADDLKAIQKEWMERAISDVGEHFSRVLAELQEVKKDGWAKGDRQAVLRAIAQECRMFGFNAPVKLQISQEAKPGEVNPELVLTDMNVDQLRILYDVYSQLMAQGKEPMTVAATLVSSTPIATA